jgi:hypothetical protein
MEETTVEVDLETTCHIGGMEEEQVVEVCHHLYYRDFFCMLRILLVTVLFLLHFK